MSAVAIQFDPTFSMGHRSAFAWPGAFESSTSTSSMLGQDFASILPPVSESTASSSSIPRTLTSSPPRSILTPEQRELKKQRDRARRDSRASVRMHRTHSPSLMGSPPLMHRTSSGSLMGSPQMSLPDVTSSMAMPVYTTAPSSVSIMSESASSLAGSPYLAPYSPPLQEQAFGSPYQQPLQPSYTMPMEYPTTYATPSEYSIPPTSMPTVGQDSMMMYRMSGVMPASGSTSVSASNSVTGSSSSSGVQDGSGHVRVVQSRPKPRCWEHGCNGRQFSTFSNLLRHQREKSGQAAKATCPNCGAEFTRTTARNGHLLHDKCKQRRSN